jgi:hypothetical protein
MLSMPKAFPSEFRRDVVAVARKAEARLHQIAKAIKQWTASAGSSHPQFSAPNGRPTRESRGLEDAAQVSETLAHLRG